MGTIESKKEKIKSKILLLEIEKSKLLGIKDTKVRELNEMDYLNKMIYEPPADKEDKRKKKSELDSTDKGMGAEGHIRNGANKNGYDKGNGSRFGTGIGYGKGLGKGRNCEEDYDDIVDIIANMIETMKKTERYNKKFRTNDFEVLLNNDDSESDIHDEKKY